MALALLFAGQGAQKVGMGRSLYEASPAARTLYDEANRVLGWDLAKLSFEGPEPALTETKVCQPALYVHGLALLAALREHPGRWDLSSLRTGVGEVHRVFRFWVGDDSDAAIVPDDEGALDLSAAQVAALCDRRFGIGGDGILRVVRSARIAEGAASGDAEWFMDYRNADGSAAEMCGNGTRVFAKYLVDTGRADIDAAPDPQAKLTEIEDRLNKLRSPFRSAETFWVEEIRIFHFLAFFVGNVSCISIIIRVSNSKKVNIYLTMIIFFAGKTLAFGFYFSLGSFVKVLP